MSIIFRHNKIVLNVRNFILMTHIFLFCSFVTGYPAHNEAHLLIVTITLLSAPSASRSSSFHRFLRIRQKASASYGSKILYSRGLIDSFLFLMDALE